MAGILSLGLVACGNDFVPTNTKKEKVKEEQKKEEKKENMKIYKVGEEGSSGNWIIKVLDAKETNLMGNRNIISVIIWNNIKYYGKIYIIMKI
ncbi:hypothetical protein N072000002_13830 [Clostridium tetani]|uniref:Lipoprotein n=1 Tax=Clostridium tetani TaxID=1513 RepID=A0ABC8ECA8_CLOTA|nr:hypothetical protein [Clostridium tetani]BDR81203.1 hypothetical protein K234311028_14490 [Clostridium tetani]BDR89582.1 hypothetical protein N072000002_13830 [Clostridium tetani]